MSKVYVGCGLTHATQKYRQAISDFKNALRQNCEVLDFHGLTDGTNAQVFHHDTSCVLNCDLFVSDYTYASTGLGYELGTALAQKKPVLALAQKDSVVTRLVLGIDLPNFILLYYDQSPAEALPLVIHWLEHLDEVQSLGASAFFDQACPPELKQNLTPAPLS